MCLYVIDIPLKRHTRRLNPTKHTHLDLTERLPQPIHEHVIESKRQCFSSNENPKLLQNESLPQPSSLCHSPIVPSGDKCEALTVDSELNSCNEVHCFEANESQQQPKSFGNDEYIESILKPSSKSYNLRSKYGTPPSSSVPDAPLQDQGTSKPQEKCHSPFKYEQQSKDTDDDNSKDSLVSSYISFEEFCEAKNSFQKMSIIEFMDGLEELSESSEEFEGLHDRKTLESRPTNTKKSLPWFRSVANHRMPSSYVRCKDVALQTDMKSNLLVHQTNVAVQTDHNPGCCLPSCSLEREVQSNTNDNLEILTSKYITPVSELNLLSCSFRYCP